MSTKKVMLILLISFPLFAGKVTFFLYDYKTIQKNKGKVNRESRKTLRFPSPINTPPQKKDSYILSLLNSTHTTTTTREKVVQEYIDNIETGKLTISAIEALENITNTPPPSHLITPSDHIE
jgi:hypothetical protein